jgi:hypothetical protein
MRSRLLVATASLVATAALVAVPVSGALASTVRPSPGVTYIHRSSSPLPSPTVSGDPTYIGGPDPTPTAAPALAAPRAAVARTSPGHCG